MNNIDQTRLTRLRSEKIDDATVKNYIVQIQQECVDVDPEIIALVLHECDYNVSSTIFRIQTGDFEDGGWKKAKSNNKKKNHNLGEQILNRATLSDSERSLSQRTSPTSSLHNGQRRNDQHQYSSSIRTNNKRHDNDSGRNHIIPNNSTNKIVPSSEQISSPKQSNEEISQINLTTIDQYEHIDNSRKKTSTKHRVPSTIPKEPVSMHATVKFSTLPIDIQFGDVQWNDSIPIEVHPSHNTPVTLDENVNASTSETDNEIIETTDQLSSSLSMVDNTLSNSLTNAPAEGTSHLSDHLTDTSSQQQQQMPLQNSITRLPPTSTPRVPEYTLPTSQFIPTNHQQNNPNPNLSTTHSHYSSLQPTNWNSQTSNYKGNPKTTIIPSGTYSTQPSYQLSQQQFLLGTNPYHPLSPTVVQLLPSIDHWTASGFPTSYESYPYGTANYMSTYSNPQQYHAQNPHSYDKEFFAHYGQQRSSNNDISYQQQSMTSSHTTNDTHSTSKLSPNAATFSQGAQLTASPSTAPVYLNPVAIPMPNYFQPVAGSTHQDRIISYPSVDNRDNRNGASYNGTNNRNNYYYHGQHQQRLHNSNPTNSNWHVQQ